MNRLKLGTLLAATTAIAAIVAAGPALADSSTVPQSGATATTTTPTPSVSTDDTNWGG